MLLTFDFKSVEEAQEFLAGLIAKPASTHPAPLDLGPAVSPAKDSAPNQEYLPPAETAPEKKKRGPKPKATPTVDLGRNLTATEVLARGLPPLKEYGIEDCRAALSGLFDTKGRDAAKAALAEFKVERIVGLKPDQYRGFIVMCETLSQPE